MIKSMTGFGKGEYSDGKRIITAEVRSVNHRYSDINVKMPRRYNFAEDKIKNIVKETVKRGKVEVAILIEAVTEDDLKISLNTAAASQYHKNLNKLKEEFGLPGSIDLALISGMPEVMKTIPDVEDEEEILRSVEIAVRDAVDAFDSMRTKEGAKLAEDLAMRAAKVRDDLKKIEKKAPQVSKTYAIKLAERIEELIGKEIEIPKDRILLEAAIFADKANITEELVRLDSHMIQMDDIISKSDRSDGKKLDFLVQEMNREANTIGSKANDMEITGIMLEIKSEVEKIREQVQNIE
ncbi:MAG TPA: YicC family protein [Bacillota bacterium]|nr:YicC family protein [Bacillota bacterium]HUM55832.1 YicC family protein [Bacillota bacterium]